MFGMTRCVVRAAFGAGRGDGALLAVPVIPAAALADGLAETGRAAAKGVAWLRRAAARVLRSAAEALDPVPVAEARTYPLALPVEAPAPEEAPVLTMPAAAQVTDAPTRARPRCAELLAQHGSIRAAARAAGVAESTFRGWCRKEGVKAPAQARKGG